MWMESHIIFGSAINSFTAKTICKLMRKMEVVTNKKNARQDNFRKFCAQKSEVSHVKSLEMILRKCGKVDVWEQIKGRSTADLNYIYSLTPVFRKDGLPNKKYNASLAFRDFLDDTSCGCSQCLDKRLQYKKDCTVKNLAGLYHAVEVCEHCKGAVAMLRMVAWTRHSDSDVQSGHVQKFLEFSVELKSYKKPVKKSEEFTGFKSILKAFTDALLKTPQLDVNFLINM